MNTSSTITPYSIIPAVQYAHNGKKEQECVSTLIPHTHALPSGAFPTPTFQAGATTPSPHLGLHGLQQFNVLMPNAYCLRVIGEIAYYRSAPDLFGDTSQACGTRGIHHCDQIRQYVIRCQLQVCLHRCIM